MIIHNGQIITKIFYNVNPPNDNSIYDIEGFKIADNLGYLLNYKRPISSKISAIYKGSDLIWLTTYEVSIKSCYGSGTWLDNYNWVEDQWKNG